MAGSIGVIPGTVAGRSGLTLLGRIRGQAGELITRASLSAVTYTVRDLTAASTIALDQPLVIADVVFDDLQQNDPRWDRDSATRPGPDGAWGFNFAAALPETLLTGYDVEEDSPYRVTAHRYQIDVRLVPVLGRPFTQVFQVTTLPVYGS